MIIIVDHSADPKEIARHWDAAIKRAVSQGWDLTEVDLCEPSLEVGMLDLHILTR